MDTALILVVEDEATISNFICRALASAGYRTLTARTGSEALTLFFSHRPELVLLDLGLPDMDGLEVLEQLRSDPGQEIPVIILTARDRESEKVRALDLGADDYVVKPFGVAEVLARIRANLRHARRVNGARGERRQRYEIGDLVLDAERHQVFAAGQEVHLTQNEFKILELLCLHAGKVLTYDFIMRRVWGPYNSGGNQILRVNMANIRRKLGENPSEPKYVHTELGVGYRLLEEN